MEFAIYSELQREQCMKLVSFAHTSVCRRASVVVAVEAVMMRPSNQKDQPGVQELSALSALNFFVSQMKAEMCAAVWATRCFKSTFSGFFTFLSRSRVNETHLCRRKLHVSAYM